MTPILFSIPGRNNLPLTVASWQVDCKTGINRVTNLIDFDSDNSITIGSDISAKAQIIATIIKLGVSNIGLSTQLSGQINAAIDAILDLAVPKGLTAVASARLEVQYFNKECTKNPGQFSLLGFQQDIVVEYKVQGDVLGNDIKSSTKLRYNLASASMKCDCATGLPVEPNTSVLVDLSTPVPVPPGTPPLAPPVIDRPVLPTNFTLSRTFEPGLAAPVAARPKEITDLARFVTAG